MADHASLRDRAALVQCRAGVADSHAHLALLDEVVSRTVPARPYADGVRRARGHLEAALSDLDRARRLLEDPGVDAAPEADTTRRLANRRA